VGGKISDVVDREAPGYRLEWRAAIRLKRVDMFWIEEVFDSPKEGLS